MAIIHSRSIVYSQNFLHSRQLVDRLIDASSVSSCDDVVEIGPGQGIITERLAGRCRRLVAVEKDQSLVDDLRQHLAGYPNVDIRDGDFLDYVLPRHPYKVFASIPFNITAAIVGKLTSGLSPPDDAYLVVQREAALRFVGSPRETLASTLLKPWFEPALVHTFRRTDFDPIPAVDVVMLRLRKRVPPLVDRTDSQLFRDVMVYCFTSRQPTLAVTLAKFLGRQRSREALRGAGIPDHSCPSEVGFARWLTLFERITEATSPPILRQIVGAEARLRQQQAAIEKVHRTRAVGSR